MRMGVLTSRGRRIAALALTVTVAVLGLGIGSARGIDSDLVPDTGSITHTLGSDDHGLDERRG